MSGGLIHPDYDAQIRSMIRKMQVMERQLQETTESIVRRKSSAFSNKQAVLKTDLPAAVNTKKDPSTAEAYLLRRNSSGDLVKTSKLIEVVNRFVNISIDAGTYIKIEHIDGEWQPYAADCPGGSNSESL